VGCRRRAPQAELVRFVRRAEGGWALDAARARAPGRGVYLCSEACAARAVKNKRYPGLGTAGTGVTWKVPSALFEREPGVYDSAVPRRGIPGPGARPAFEAKLAASRPEHVHDLRGRPECSD
jgi:hypothetical protein